MFFFIVLGCVVGFVGVVYIDCCMYFVLEIKYGVGKVLFEYCFYGVMVGSVFNLVSLFWFGWFVSVGVYWVSFVVVVVFFVVGNIMVYSSGVLYIMNLYGLLYGVSVFSVNSLLRYVFGGVFFLFIV